MAVLFHDNFNRADDDNVGSNWAADGVLGLDADILNNKLRFATISAPTMMPTTLAAHDDVADCSVAVEQHSANCDGGPCVRASGVIADTEPTAYAVDAFDTSVEFHRYNDSNTPTILGSTSVTRAVGDEWKLEVTGTDPVALKVFQNGVQRGTTYNDTAGSRITAAGRSGLVVWSSGADSDWDNFTVDDLQGEGPPPPAGMNVFWLLRLPASARQNSVNGVTVMLVEAPDEATARDLASARFAGDPSWAAATATELESGMFPDYGGFEFRVVVSGSPVGSADAVNLTYLAGPGESLDTAMAALVVILNRHPLINGATWTAGTKTLLVAPGTDGLGDRRLRVDVTPPSFKNPAPTFVGTLTHLGLAGADLAAAFTDFDTPPGVVAEAKD